LCPYTGLYVAIENHFDPKSLLIKYGLLSGEKQAQLSGV